jgi:hypothetical protein
MRIIYFFLFTVLLATIATTGSHAQTVFITTGTAGTPAYNAGPVYRSSASSAFDASRYCYLYTAAELSAAGITPGSVISLVGWVKNNTTTSLGAGGIFRIYMKNTSATDFSLASETWANLNTGATLVYENLTQVIPATANPDYIDFPLTTNFVYTGGSLEIATEWDINQVAGNASTGTFDWLWSTVVDRIYGTGNTTLAPITTLSSTTNSISTIDNRRPFIKITYSGGTSGIDVGAQSLVAPAVAPNNCYTSSETVTIQIRNYSTNPIDFSVNPVTVTTNVTGAATQTLSATVNTGTLASATTLNVTMSGTLNMSATGVYTFNASAVVAGDVIPANNAMPAANITKAVLAAGTVTATPGAYCLTGGTPTLSTVGATGYGGLQWQQSTTPGSGFTDIPGATTTPYTVGTSITQTMYYRLRASCNGNTVTSNEATVTLNNPQITGTTPGASCGPGPVTVSLAATGTGTVLNWYDVPSGGVAIGTGSPFTTPPISGNTTYYVSSVSGGGIANLGLAGQLAGTSGSGTTNFGLVFDAFAPFVLKSVVVYPIASAANTAGTVTIDVISSTGAVLNTATVNVTGNPVASATAQTVILNFNIAAGTNLKLRPGSRSASITGLLFEPSATAPPGGNYGYPFVLPGVVSINHSTLTAAPTNTARLDLYYYFYNWEIVTGCESARTPVLASITTPPSATINYAGSPYCSNAGTATVTQTGSAGGTYSSTAGLTINPSNGAVTLGTSTPGTYTVTYTIPASGGCPLYTTTAIITINNCGGSTSDLSITKTNGVTTYTAGGTTTYTIVVANNGPNASIGAIVIDNFPAAFTSVGWTAVYTGGATGPASGITNINATVNLPIGATATFTAVCNISPAASGSLSNTATVTVPAGDTDPDPANNSATDTDAPNPQADLNITKTDGSATAVPGGSTIYTITVGNAGPGNVTGATVTDNFPAAISSANWTAVYAGGATGPAAGSGNISALVNIPSGGSVTFTVTCIISAGATGSLSNTATVTTPAGTTDPDPANNSATDTDTLVPNADLSITKTDGVANYTPGGTTTYTIIVSNNGPGNVNAAIISDNFPAVITGISWTAVYTGGATGPAAGTSNINVPVDFPVGATATFTAVCNISPGASGNLVNTATVTVPAGTTDPNPGNNSSTDIDLQGSLPVITVNGTLTGFTTCAGTASAEQTFTVSGTNLSANLVITAPTGFEVSISSGSGYSGSISLTPAGGNLSTTTIYVRLSAGASGNPSGNITCASTGATTQNVAVSGTVNPTPNAIATPASQTICTGGPITAILFSGSVPGTTFNWSRDNLVAATGIAASGSGNISGSLTNSTSAPVTVTFTITPTASGCPGAAITATVIVNPTPSVNVVSNQTVCNGASTAAVTFSGAVTGTVYNWVNNTPSIGLASSGSGNISSFAAVNNGTSAVTATVIVTPSYTNAGVTCTGTPATFTITVNPTATVNVVANQVVCNNSSTSAIAFSSPATGGTIVYNWINNTTSIGLAASGSGNIASFIATNATTAPVIATITVTPAYTNGVTCTGTARTFTITVNPTPTVSAVANQSVCAGNPTTAVSFSGTVTGTVFNWTNNTTSIGLAASGSGNIAGFNAINNGTTPVIATVTVTPSYTNAGVTCTGTPVTFIITVNPRPTVTCPANIVVNAGAGICTAVVNYPAATATGTPAPTITYSIPSGSTFPVGVTTINVTATNTCGTASCSFTVTVVDVQAPVITTQPANRTVCTVGSATFSVVATNGASYQWQLFNGSSFVNIAGATAATYTVANATLNMNTNSYRVVVTGLCSAIATSTHATLFVNSLPTISLSATPVPVLLPTQTTTITATTLPPGGTFVWFLNGVVIPGATGPELAGLGVDNSGSYRAVYTDPNGCVSTSADLLLSGAASGNLYVYPNPNNGQFQVRFYNEPNEKATVNIYDEKGTNVYSRSFTTTVAYTSLNIDISNMPAGKYLVEVVNSVGRRVGAKWVIAYR